MIYSVTIMSNGSWVIQSGSKIEKKSCLLAPDELSTLLNADADVKKEHYKHYEAETDDINMLIEKVKKEAEALTKNKAKRCGNKTD